MKPLFFLSFLLIFPMLMTAQSTSGYCINKGPRGNVWLQKVSIGTWVSNSSANEGYLYNPTSKLTLRTDTTYAVQLDLGGYPRIQDTAYWRIWIDFNGDKDFEDAGEQVLQTKSLHKSSAKTTLALKSALVSASDKFLMRVILSKAAFSAPCGSNTTIEIEDYLVDIQSSCPTPSVADFSIGNILQNQATLYLKKLSKDNTYRWNLFSIAENLERVGTIEHLDSLVLGGLSADHEYKLRLGIVCAATQAIKWSEFVLFHTLKRTINDCDPIAKSKLSFTQLDTNQVELKVNDIDPQTILEWRYRKIGADNEWLYFSTPPKKALYIYDVALGVNYEFQVREFCKTANLWGNWSESQTFSTIECVLPAENHVFINLSFFNFPNLDISFNVFDQRVYNYSYRYYFRQKGSSSWIDTISSTTRLAKIENLIPDSTYELSIEVYCGTNVNVFNRTITVPPACYLIKKSDINVYNLTNTTADVYVTEVSTRTSQLRYRIKGEIEYLYQPKVGFGGSARLKDLQPGKTYELSARILCADSTQLEDWSEATEFTTKDCLIPLGGDLAVVQYYGADSIQLVANFFADTYENNLDYFWKYKPSQDTSWTIHYQKGDNRFLLKNLQKGTKYEVQLVVRCPGILQDSLVLSRTLVATETQCNLPADPNIMSIKSAPTQWNITVDIPRGYAYEIRFRVLNSGAYKYYLLALPAGSLVGFGSPQFLYEVQIRLVCPNGNVSPWSETVKPLPFTQPDLPEFAMEPLEAAKVAKLKIAPNPSSGQLSILFPAEMEPQPEAYLEILNTAGQRIMALKTAIDPAQTLPINLSKQTPGLYILRIQAGQKVYTERIMIASNR